MPKTKTKPTSKATKKKTKKAAKKTKALAAAAPVQMCLDAIDAAFIVGGCLPTGTHENDDTLEQTGLISPELRKIFRECVFNGVRNKGCDINRGDIPNDGSTTVGTVRRAVVNNSHST